MNRKTIKITSLVFFTLLVGIAICYPHKESQLSDLAIANIEALSSGESEGGCASHGCNTNYDFDCFYPVDGEWAYCPNMWNQ